MARSEDFPDLETERHVVLQMERVIYGRHRNVETLRAFVQRAVNTWLGENTDEQPVEVVVKHAVLIKDPNANALPLQPPDMGTAEADTTARHVQADPAGLPQG